MLLDREVVHSRSVLRSLEGELLYLQDRTSPVIELDDLVGRYSADKLVEAVTRSV